MAKQDAFTRAYIEAALWSTNDESDEQGGEPLDKNYGPGDIDPETMALIEEDCAYFQERYGRLIEEDDSPAIDKWGRWEKAGHDFWLTRNGHGAGFWDGDWPKHGDALTEAAHAFGEFYLTVGDDGVIYGPPADYYRQHHPVKGHIEFTANEPRHGQRMADFSTLPEIIEHARMVDGASHVLIAGTRTKLYFPLGGGRYEEAKVWREHGYWHSEAPGDRTVVERLPNGAQPIETYPGSQTAFNESVVRSPHHHPQTLINTPDDMEWLRDVHLPDLDLQTYHSAILHGNEDYPSQIEVYTSRDPNVDDQPVTYVLDPKSDDKRYVVVGASHHRSPRRRR